MKIPSFKNKDILVAPEDDEFLNDIYPVDWLLDFRLRAQPHAL